MSVPGQPFGAGLLSASRHAAVNRIGPRIQPANRYAVREPEGNISAPMLAATRAADSLTESRARWA